MKQLTLSFILLVLNFVNGQSLGTFSVLIDYEGNGEAPSTGVLLDDGSIVVGGGVTNNLAEQGVIIVKLDSLGEEIFKKAYFHQFTYFYANTLLGTPDSGFVLGGSVDWFGSNAMLFKLNQHGDSLWISHFGTNQFETSWSTRQTSEGDFISLGHTFGFGAMDRNIYIVKADYLGNEIWERNFQIDVYNTGRFLLLTNDGGFLASSGVGAGGPNDDVFSYLSKHDSLGHIEWDSIYYNSGDDCAIQSIINQDENFFQVGCNDTIFDIEDYYRTQYVQEMNVSGHVLWRIYLNRPHSLVIRRFIQTRSENYIIVGETDPDKNFQTSGWIAKVNPFGEILWERTYETMSDRDDYFYDIHETPDGKLVVIGVGWNEPFHSDLWVLKLDSMGCLESGCDTLYNNITPTQSHSEPNIVHVFPNPFYSSATVVISLPVDERRGLSFTLYDVMGSFVKPIPIPKSELGVGGDMMFTIERDGLRAGVYIYSLENNNGLVYSGKLLVR